MLNLYSHIQFFIHENNTYNGSRNVFYIGGAKPSELMEFNRTIRLYNYMYIIYFNYVSDVHSVSRVFFVVEQQSTKYLPRKLQLVQLNFYHEPATP